MDGITALSALYCHNCHLLPIDGLMKGKAEGF